MLLARELPGSLPCVREYPCFRKEWNPRDAIAAGILVGALGVQFGCQLADQQTGSMQDSCLYYFGFMSSGTEREPDRVPVQGIPVADHELYDTGLMGMWKAVCHISSHVEANQRETS